MTTTSDATTRSTRRQALRLGGLGAAAAAVLAACGTKDHSKPGQSGLDPTTTEVTPTVPVPKPSEDALATELTNLRTAASLQLVVADVYRTYGPKLSDASVVAAAARFADDHTTLAGDFNDAIEDGANRIDAPNEWVQKSLIDPIEQLLTTDAAISDLFASLESMLAATCFDAVQAATTGEWRARYATIGAGSAQRLAVLGNGGSGVAPTSATFPSTDLVSNQAKLPVEAAKADSGDDAEGDEGN